MGTPLVLMGAPAHGRLWWVPRPQKVPETLDSQKTSQGDRCKITSCLIENTSSLFMIWDQRFLRAFRSLFCKIQLRKQHVILPWKKDHRNLNQSAFHGSCQVFVAISEGWMVECHKSFNLRDGGNLAGAIAILVEVQKVKDVLFPIEKWRYSIATLVYQRVRVNMKFTIFPCWGQVILHAGLKIWRCMDPIENGDIPLLY